MAKEKKSDIYYLAFFISLFLTINEIKIKNPYLIESGKHKRSKNYKEKYRVKFGLKTKK